MTKKMLVPFSMEKVSPVGKSFVVPIHDGEKPIYVSLDTLKKIEYGAVVYVGREISSEDIFAKIIQAGTKILPSVDDQMSMIRDYLEQVPKLKIGDIVKLDFGIDGSVQLEKQKKPNTNSGKRNIP